MTNESINDMLFSIALAEGRYTHPLSLARHSAQIYSQNGEDGMIAEVFRRIGTQNRVFVEIGVGDGQQNNTRLLLEQGWTGVWVDSNADMLATAQATFATYVDRGALRIVEGDVGVETVNVLLDSVGVPETLDFLSLDIDQNTSHAWRALQLRARVACIEYNAALPATIALEVPYHRSQLWTGTNWFGASLKALEQIGTTKGMHLVGCDLNGVNAFFVDASLTDGCFQPPFEAAAHYEPIRLSAVRRYGHPPSEVARSWVGKTPGPAVPGMSNGEAATNALAIAQARLAAMETSTSWRLTAPLRGLARLLFGRC
jgi:hypothetical protein